MLSAGKGIAGKSHGKSAPYRLRPGNGRPARGHTGVTDAVCREGPRHPPSGTCSQTVPPFADALNHLRMKGYDLRTTGWAAGRVGWRAHHGTLHLNTLKFAVRKKV